MSKFIASLLSQPFLIEPGYARAAGAEVSLLINGKPVYSPEQIAQAQADSIPYVVMYNDEGAPSGRIEPLPTEEPALGTVNQSGAVAILSYSGPVFKNTMCDLPGTRQLAKAIGQAEANPNIHSMVLVVDSPGGAADYTDVVAKVIANTSKPVVTLVDTMAASAMYYLVSGSNEIYASSPLARIGSIGVVTRFADLQPYYEKQGVVFREIFATLSTQKGRAWDQLHSDDPAQQDAYRKEVLDPINEAFHTHVKETRPNADFDSDSGVLSGRMYYAGEAQSKGLIDGVLSFEGVVARASELGMAWAKENNQSNNHQDPINMGQENNKVVVLGEKYPALATLMKGTEENAELEITQDGQDIIVSEEILERIEASVSQLADLSARNQTLEEENTNVTARNNDLTKQTAELIAATGEEDHEKAMTHIAELNKLAESSAGKSNIPSASREPGYGGEKKHTGMSEQAEKAANEAFKKD